MKKLSAEQAAREVGMEGRINWEIKNSPSFLSPSQAEPEADFASIKRKGEEEEGWKEKQAGQWRGDP